MRYGIWPNFCKFLHGPEALFSQIPLKYTVNSDKTEMWGEMMTILSLIEEAFLLEGQQHLITECKLKIGKGHAANPIAQILYKLRHILCLKG